MTKKRKLWLISWAVIIVLAAVFSDIITAIFPLVLFGFIELIRLFIVSVKRSKIKLEEQKLQQNELKEQHSVIQETDTIVENSSQSESSTELPIVDKNVNPIKGLIISVIYAFLFPLRMLNTFFYATVNMDSAAWFGKLFGIGVLKCRYCDRYFSSFHGLRYSCEHSPTGKHRE